MSLWSLFLNHQGRVIHKWKHYFPAYERHFSRFVNQPVTFIEIGCGDGGSLQLWKQYLGPFATIIGIDIRPECKEFEEDQIHVRIGDQSDWKFLKSIIDEFGQPDVVLDDGSHIMDHVNMSFSSLYHQVAPNGVYFVEDLHTAYWKEFGGGLKRSGSFIEIVKDRIDTLNADHTRGEVQVTDFTRTTQSMHIYDSIVVFEKGSVGEKAAVRVGGTKLKLT
jgi:SAM-dependent methyltransferase